MPSVNISCCGDTYVRYNRIVNNAEVWEKTGENHGSDSMLRVGNVGIDQKTATFYAVLQFDLKGQLGNPKAYVINKANIKIKTDLMPEYASITYAEKWLDKPTAYETLLTSANSDIDFPNLVQTFSRQTLEKDTTGSVFTSTNETPGKLEDFEGFVTFAVGYVMSNSYSAMDIRIYGRTTQYPPVLYLEYEEKIPSAPTINLGANSMYLEKPFSVSWVHNEAYNVPQKSAEIQWNANGGAWNTVTTALNAYTFPGNTFPAGTITLRIRTYNEFGKASPFSTVSFAAQKTIPAAPAVNYPAGVFVNALAPAVFNWVYNAADGIRQAKIEIIWRKQGAASWNTVKADTGGNTYTFPANTFKSGVVEWGIRTYNTYGNPSEYSYASFTAIGQSEAAVIRGVKNACLTEITWETEEQNIYQVEIHKGDKTVYDSGECPGYTVRSYKPDIFLEDGDYVCMLRVKNNSGIWSEWAAKQFSISTRKPVKPGIFVGNKRYGVEIRAAFMGDRAVVYKGEAGSEGFRPLCFISSGSVWDYEMKAGARYEYFVRTFYDDGGYSDSGHRSAMISYDGFLLSPLDAMEEKIALRRHTETYIPVSVSVGNGNIYTHYLGRDFPVREGGGFRDKVISLSCYVDRAEYAVIEAWYMGNRDLSLLSDALDYAVSISSMSIKNAFFNKGYTLSIEFTVLDRDEGVRVNV